VSEIDDLELSAFEAGKLLEQKRIIKLLEEWFEVDADLSQGIEPVIALIKEEHTHELDVFGAPCDCGTRHEYCGSCGWVESCEREK
jgi:hypothetical protein